MARGGRLLALMLVAAAVLSREITGAATYSCCCDEDARQGVHVSWQRE